MSRQPRTIPQRSSWKQNTTYVRNIRRYLLAALFNAPSTMDCYYTALVNHDLYGGGSRGRPQ